MIQSGHTGPVSAIQFQATSNSLVTAGVDGVVKVWDIGKLHAVYSQPLAPRNIYLLAVHPQASVYAAVFAEEGEYTLVVRDWSKNNEIFRVSFSHKPLMVEFSPRGTYLAVCVENWRSLYLYRADDGEAIGAFSSGFGIVSYVAFSTKESTVMTYQPAGKIIYWETETGRKSSELKTLAGLLPISLSSNKVHLVCSRKNEIVFLDVVTGKAASSLDFPGLVLYSGDRQGSRLAFYSNRRGERETVSLYSIGSATAQEIFKNSLSDTNAFTSLLATDNSVFAGNNRGEVFLMYKNNSVKIIGNNLMEISDLAFRGNSLILGTLRRLFVFRSDFFLEGKNPDIVPTALSFRHLSHPYAGDTIGMAFDANDDIRIWKKTGTTGSMAILDPESLAVRRQVGQFPAAPLECLLEGDLVLTVAQDGSCSVVDANDGTPRFQPLSAGINTAVFVPPAVIICGKSRLSSYESSLALIKADTGETTFLNEAADIVYEIAYDRKTGTLFYIGVEKKGGSMLTVVKSRSGKDLKNVKTIFSKPGRFFNSVVAYVGDEERLYFSLEENVVYAWDGTTVTALESSLRPVKRLYAFPKIVYALNTDSSITAWNRSDGKLLFTLFLFNNLSWLVLTREGYHCSQGDIAPFVKVYEEGPESTGVPDRYKLNVTVSMNAKDSP